MISIIPVFFFNFLSLCNQDYNCLHCTTDVILLRDLAWLCEKNLIPEETGTFCAGAFYKNLSFRLSSEPNVIRRGWSLKNENVLKNNSMVSGSYPSASFNLAKKYRNFWEDDVDHTRKKVAKTFSSNAVILNPTKQSSYIPSK